MATFWIFYNISLCSAGSVRFDLMKCYIEILKAGIWLCSVASTREPWKTCELNIFPHFPPISWFPPFPRQPMLEDFPADKAGLQFVIFSSRLRTFGGPDSLCLFCGQQHGFRVSFKTKKNSHSFRVSVKIKFEWDELEIFVICTWQ